MDLSLPRRGYKQHLAIKLNDAVFDHSQSEKAAFGGKMFKPEVAAKLGCYVYRLLDPRNGLTFYVGKGTGNRVFSHARGELVLDDEEPLSPKLDLIREIREAGLTVQHLIHRHGLDDATAFHVEAALIDAYPSLTNAVRGHRADTLGCAWSEDIVLRYQAEPAIWKHRMLLVGINRTGAERSTYEAARFAWKVSRRSLASVEYVLAVRQGLVVDAFIAKEWLPATLEHFPEQAEALPTRLGFRGERAPDHILAEYVQKAVPVTSALSQQGIRYVEPVRSDIS